MDDLEAQIKQLKEQLRRAMERIAQIEADLAQANGRIGELEAESERLRDENDQLRRRVQDLECKLGQDSTNSQSEPPRKTRCPSL